MYPHWPAHPCGVGVILGESNICGPEEGRFNVWNQSFTDGDPAKTAVFPSFHTSLRLPNLITQEKTPTAFGVIRTLSWIDVFFFDNLPMAEAR